MYKQIDEFIHSKLSPLTNMFQHCLLNMIENWRKKIDNSKYVGILSIDLSKAFGTIDHNLLIAKLEAYGFSYSFLKYLKSYLDNRQQRVNINNNYSSLETILKGITKSSILVHFCLIFLLMISFSLLLILL